MDQRAQTNCHASLWTWCTQTNMCAHQLTCPLGPTHRNLGALLMSVHPNLFGVPLLLVSFPNVSFHAWTSPLARSHAQGAQFHN
jgi:hypothetical protein